MANLPIVDNFRFTARNVVANEDAFHPMIVNGIYLCDGTFASGGEDWCFTRSHREGYDCLATTVDSMELSVEGGIIDFDISRNRIVCKFDSATAEQTLVRRLTIDYRLDDATWADVLAQAKLIFLNAPYFRVTPAPVVTFPLWVRRWFSAKGD